jgi:DNA-binding XRE family transcriptional regulator
MNQYRPQDFNHDTLQTLISTEMKNKPHMTDTLYNEWLGLSVGISSQTIRNLRNGTANPSKEVAQALSGHFRVSVETLYRITHKIQIAPVTLEKRVVDPVGKFKLLKQFVRKSGTTPKQTAQDIQEKRLAQFLNGSLHGKNPRPEVVRWYTGLPTEFKRGRGRPRKTV